jgi:uncharacterized protein YegP (UPF0339 family)
MRTSSLLRFASAPALAALLIGCAFDEVEPDVFVSIESTPRPFFELFENSTGKYSFRFTSENHDTLLQSKWYETRKGALGGIVSVMDNGGLASRYRVVDVGNGGYGVELVAGNGVVIAESFLYASPEAAERAIEDITYALADYLEFKHQRTGARFEIYQDEYGRYFFDVFASDGRRLLTSDPYSSESAALNGAFVTRDTGVRIDRYRVMEMSGGYYLELRAQNGRLLATSPTFGDRAAAEASRDATRALLSVLPIL